ncbi:hypothetical protein V0R37_15075 [Pollutimonas sp. H1-120]|uniref:hypothetical protein n=1 Tax=Pollutimonas sp. H1-120 TaxID=3148824 RepID=UPI003B52E706
MLKLIALAVSIFVFSGTPYAKNIAEKGEWLSEKLGLEPFSYPEPEPPRTRAQAKDQFAPQPVPPAAQENPAPRAAALPPGDQSGIKKNDVWKRLNDSMMGRPVQQSGDVK